jgi:hypothetical protein
LDQYEKRSIETWEVRHETVLVVRNKDQWIRVSVVTQPIVVDAVVLSKCRTVVRVSFQRVVRNDRGLASRQESIVEPQIYRDFFDKLSQSLFLEANAI